jgi:hypothetical protein
LDEIKSEFALLRQGMARMMPIAYSNILLELVFRGCGRLLSLHPDHHPATPVPGYRRAEPQAVDMDCVLRAIVHFAPEYRRQGIQHPAVYQRENGRGREYGWRSQEFAYLLAALRCVRPLRAALAGLPGDISCTGRIVQHGTTFALSLVDPETFVAKREAFLAVPQDPYQPEPATVDPLFFVPELTFMRTVMRTVENAIRCQDGGALVCSWQDFVARLSSTDWAHRKTVVTAPETALIDVLNVFFDTSVPNNRPDDSSSPLPKLEPGNEAHQG